VVLANIGLFGLVSVIHRRRTREIGIRKANGALPWQIVWLLGSRILVWIVVAISFAIPVSRYIVNLWLRNFAVRTAFSWWVIPLACLIVVASTILTTGFITYRAARRNPVDTLRYE
jgi:putative ABC transport system permease protein